MSGEWKKKKSSKYRSGGGTKGPGRIRGREGTARFWGVKRELCLHDKGGVTPQKDQRRAGNKKKGQKKSKKKGGNSVCGARKKGY